MAHLRTHSDERPFTCKYCTKAFKHKHLLKCHERLHFRDNKPTCQVCQEQFQSGTELQDHIKNTHTGIEQFLKDDSIVVVKKIPKKQPASYKCIHCDYSTHTVTLLKSHMKTHTGESPFVCKFCDKRFTHQHHWKLHEKSHKILEFYKCKFCEKPFVLETALKAHEYCCADNPGNPFKVTLVRIDKE